MRQKIATAAILIMVAGSLWAQQTADNFLAETSIQDIQEVSVTRFEDPGYWVVTIPSDNGIVRHNRLASNPLAKEPLEGEQLVGYESQDQYVLGVKTQFLKRGFTEIYVQARRPIAIPGITQQISVWVAGRGIDHELHLVVRDVYGEQKQLFMGTLNHTGWRQLTVTIPPYEKDNRGFIRGIQQYDHRLASRPEGLEIMGLKIIPNFIETYGTYYVYFDDMRAVTDLFILERDPDDPIDTW